MAPPVLLVATDPGLAHACARCLQEADRTFRLIAPGRYPAVRRSRWCVGGDLVDPQVFTSPALAERLQAASRAVGGAVVVPAGMRATRYLAEHGDLFAGLPRFPLSGLPVLTRLDDKGEFTAWMAELGLPQPATRLVTDPGEACLAGIDGPVVVKPLLGQAGQGVRVVNDPQDLPAVLADARAAGELPLLVQDFVPGEDRSVSALAEHGRLRRWVVQRGLAGHPLDYLDEPDVVALAAAVVTAARFHGVINLDLRRDSRDGSLALIECNPRLFSSVHLAAWAGRNLLADGLALAEGRPLLPDTAPITGSVLPTAKGLAAAVRRRPLSPATRRMLRAERADPVSAGLRLVENHLGWKAPRWAARLTGGPAPA